MAIDDDYREEFGFKRGDYPKAESAYDRILSLPLNLRVTKDDALDVIAAVISIVDRHRR